MINRRHRTEEATINLTPMIDVVFLLVIFFMVGSKFGPAESQIAIDLPTASDSGATIGRNNQRVVAVTAAGLSLDGVTMTADAIGRTLAGDVSRNPGVQVAVRADSQLSHQAFVRALETVRGSGVTKIGIATRSRR